MLKNERIIKIEYPQELEDEVEAAVGKFYALLDDFLDVTKTKKFAGLEVLPFDLSQLDDPRL